MKRRLTGSDKKSYTNTFDQMTPRRALALALTALDDVANRNPDLRVELAQAQAVIRDMLQAEREFNLPVRTHVPALTMLRALLHAERQCAYDAAVELVRAIDGHLQRGTRHFRAADGRLLEELTDVVHAILDNELQEAS